MKYSLFVSCPKGLEYLLEEELRALGLNVTKVNPQGVYGEANIATLYQVCLWSRIANRVQLILFNGQAHNQQTIHNLCKQYPWQTVFSVEKTLAIEFHGSSPQIKNTMFGAQIVKDGIVDYFRSLLNKRPSVDKDKPQIIIHAYLKNDDLTVSLDLTGYSLHQRGYRLRAGIAPLKENVAAAMLLRARWPELANAGYSLQDPFCGVGTIVIEAAMIAANIAPGLLRNDQALIHWSQHQNSLWEKIRVQALKQIKPITNKLIGTDTNSRMISSANENAERAGVARLVEFVHQELANCKPHSEKGLVICNPPYGERMGEETQLIPLYRQLGKTLHGYYQGWEAAFLTASPLLAKATGLRSNKQYTIFNGPIECKLYLVLLNSKNQLKREDKQLSSGAQMFKNRLEKNYQHLQKWAKKNNVSSYRLYDADLPEYAYAIDLYNDYAVLQEYMAPATIPIHKAEQRSLDVYQVVPTVLGIEPNHVVVKQRKRQKGSDQYKKLNQKQQKIIVREGNARFKVNLVDYLDTGLFLDHRLLRLSFAKLKPEVQFLNCFCYTASASVHAALAGAITTNVDLSKTYLTWAEENFKLNNIDLSKHQFIQQDCLIWLKTTRQRFDVIFLDPPSFSNSKKMEGILDIQRDHVMLIKAAMKLLYPGGVLYFSCNLKSFKMSSLISDEFAVKDISNETIDVDFKRNKKIHQCFRLTAA